MPDKITKFINLLSSKTREQLKLKLELIKSDKSDVKIIDIDYRGNIY